MSTKKPFDILVYIGRFQPFHNGHKHVVDKALAVCNTLIVLMGSAQKPRSIKDPWTIDERIVMIRRSLSEADSQRVTFGSLFDTLYNDEHWVRSVQDEVRRVIQQRGDDQNVVKIGLIGHEKDPSSYYLQMFPQWKRLDVSNLAGLSATQIRDALLDTENETGNMMLVESGVPTLVFEFLKSFRKTPVYAQLVKEFEFIRGYKKSWEKAPYPPTFVTTDAIVVHSGHVLLIRRRAEPGKGLWAWPGGFVDQKETILDACIRELREETRLKIPAPVLRGSIKAQRIFDHPERSMRGRTITHAFLFEFPMGELPDIKASDDADKARWIPLSQFFEMRDQLFEDHFDIGAYFLGSI